MPMLLKQSKISNMLKLKKCKKKNLNTNVNSKKMSKMVNNFKSSKDTTMSDKKLSKCYKCQNCKKKKIIRKTLLFLKF